MSLRLVALILSLLIAAPAAAEDGYRLWLRYPPLASTAEDNSVVANKGDPIIHSAVGELRRGLAGRSERLIIGTLDDPAIAALHLDLNDVGDEGYRIRSMRVGGAPATVIAARRPAGVLYGAFAYLRLVQTARLPRHLDLLSKPRYSLRLLDHWDNLDGFVERGYAGRSIFRWDALPAADPRLTDYARANASIGINGAVLNNVNASATILTPAYLRKVASVADLLRPWGMRVYLTARFSAPIEIGGLKTADPLDPAVRAFWASKVDAIYRAIPDFGGFLVKANSEGQPGPQQYGRSHADGANMLADALAPHGGVVMWRAFVYSPGSTDRVRQAFDEFAPLDGKFRSNVIVQVKNGPLDFQPREPFHPLFGAMPRTRLMFEGQVTKEYLGFSTHLAFLGPLWKEVLSADTCRPRCGHPVAGHLSGMAGVANVGDDRNWTGSDFDQANWYAFGRLAWDPSLDPSAIADEWIAQTWGRDARVMKTVRGMMMRSREAQVDVMTPLGLTHLMGSNHHYGPAPWVDDMARPDWNPTYYHRADRGGIGFDRTATGSGAVTQYAPPLAACWSSPSCVPDRLLLWFHHLPWTHRMRSGRTLWAAMVDHYDRGLAEVARTRADWTLLKGRVDAERFAAVSSRLAQQEREARWWRDASLAYFSERSGLPIPAGHRPPLHSLETYRSMHFTNVPGTPR